VSPRPKKATPYRGTNRRRPDPPPSLTQTVVGVAMIAGGFAVYLITHHGGFEIFPIVVSIIGGALVEPRAITAAARAMPWRRNGHTAEQGAAR
jgi:hypothetical protein